MKKMIIGTTNSAKVNQLSSVLTPLGFDVAGLPKNIDLPEVIEDQNTAQGNARKKALMYSSFLGQIVFSMDNALYLEGLSLQDQPGLNVRRIPGHTARPTDEQMLQYYVKVIDSLGGTIKGYWEFAICIAGPQGVIAETTIKSPRSFTSKKSDKIVDGYPLESIQIEPESGKYISEMTKEEQGEFWRRMIGKEIEAFVSKIIL